MTRDDERRREAVNDELASWSIMWSRKGIWLFEWHLPVPSMLMVRSILVSLVARFTLAVLLPVAIVFVDDDVRAPVFRANDVRRWSTRALSMSSWDVCVRLSVYP